MCPFPSSTDPPSGAWVLGCLEAWEEVGPGWEEEGPGWEEEEPGWEEEEPRQ